WIRQNEGASERDEERPIQHAPCAILIGKVSAVRAEDAGGNRICSADHACGGDADTVDADQIARQPQGERYEGAEDKKVVQPETPNLDVLEWREFKPRALRLLAADRPRALDGILAGREPEDDAYEREGDRPYLGHTLPAVGDQHKG